MGEFNLAPAAQSTKFAHLTLQGARKVLTECISLKKGDVLALFWDETTDETAEVFLKTAQELGLDVWPRRIRLEDQKRFSPNEGLSSEDREALDSARGILTCLSNHVACTTYRTELLRAGTNAGKRFGHMPGANLKVLAHAVNINYLEASSRCDDLALALTLGEKVRLRTYIPAKNGSPEQPCDLDFEIGGLHRSPITSTGIIPLGTWGNLPGGETFIAPIEDTANGIFVLNGAFKNYIIEPPGYLRLHFEDGRLVNVDGTPAEEAAFNEILDYARSLSDAFYDSLAELGIGVNPGVKELTGNALFDEKCYGTAHIAIGDNSRYGGRHSSRIHEDLISRAPSIWVDDKQILERGRDAFEAAEWRDKLDENATDSTLPDPNCAVSRTNIAAEGGAFGRLRVRRSVSAGRLCVYTIGEPSTSRILAQVHSLVPRLGGYIRFEELAQRAQRDPGFSPNLVWGALGILVKHDLICLSPPQQESETA